MLSDLLPTSIARLWWLARPALVAGSVIAVIGAATIGTGRTIDAPQKRTASVPVVVHQVATASVELMHDTDTEAEGFPNVVVPETVEPVKASAPTQRVVWMEVTAYCACKKCCGPNAIGLTASGKDVSYNDGKFVAADTSVLPFGTKLMIPGYNDKSPVEVIDRGGAIKGNKLDVFYASHEDALQWGRQKIAVSIVE